MSQTDNVGMQTGTIIFATSFPIYQSRQADGSTRTIASSNIALGLVFFLASLFGDNARSGSEFRNLQEDQLDIFHQIESSIAASGYDGHACILRFICEMQTNPFSHSSIIGEILTLLFTLKPGNEHILLKDYISAEMAGRATINEGMEGEEKTCAERYHTCPISVFSAFRHFSTPDKPFNTTSHLQN